jgi:signal transduction histidine kinase
MLLFVIIGLPGALALWFSAGPWPAGVWLLLGLMFLIGRQLLGRLSEKEQEIRHLSQQSEQRNQQIEVLKSQLVDSEKMASLGQLTAGIAHEINNPINFVFNNVSSLTRDIEELKSLLEAYRKGEKSEEELKAMLEELEPDFLYEEIEQLLHGIKEGSSRTKEIVAGLRNFSRLDETEFKFADLQEGLDSTLTLLHNQLKKRITVHKSYAKLPRLACKPGKLNQVFMNLLVNAIQAIDGEGEIWVEIAQEGEFAMVRIRDNGSGMPESVRARIFESFYTTKEVGKGTGLGLSISYDIIQQHNGSLTVESAPGKGTTFTIRLPMKQEGD